MSEHNDLILAYSKNPPNERPMADAHFSHFEQSRVCADTVEVFLKVDTQGVIQDWSFQGNTSVITKACSAIFWESIVGMHISEVSGFTYEYMKEILRMDLTPKRRYAGVMALLATRNAIHAYRADEKNDDFSDVLP